MRTVKLLPICHKEADNLNILLVCGLSYGIGGGAIVDGDHLFGKDGKVGSDVEAVLAKYGDGCSIC